MADFFDSLELWFAKSLILLGVAVGFWQVLFRPLYALIRLWPSPFRLRDVPTWLSHREWLVIFMVANALIFVASLRTEESHGIYEGLSVYLKKLVDEPLIGAEVGSLLLAASLVVGEMTPSGHVVLEPNMNTRFVWGFALALAILANALALVDSIGTWAHGDIGPLHFLVWCLQNFGCLFFYSFLAVNLLRGPAGHLFLISAQIAWLWLVVIVLVVVSILDLFVLPMNR